MFSVRCPKGSAHTFLPGHVTFCQQVIPNRLNHDKNRTDENIVKIKISNMEFKMEYNDTKVNWGLAISYRHVHNLQVST